MSSDLLRWLLDVDVIPRDAEGVRLAWEHPWPAWAWALFILVVAAFAAWSYGRLVGRRLGRGALCAVRAGLLVLLLIVVSGPMLELPRESVEEDWVIVLADRSESMTIADAEAMDGRRASRDEQLRSVIDANADVWTSLADQRQLVWMGFHTGAFSLAAAAAPQGEDGAATAPWAVDLGAAAGPRTNLSTAVQQALQRAAARPLAGIVVLSDGRTNEPPHSGLLRRLKADAVPVFVVPLGSDEPLGDLAVRRVEAPRRAFVRDKVPVVVELDRLGSAGAGLTGAVRLVDLTSGAELDRVDLGDGGDGGHVTLTAEPQLAGEVTWQVVIDTAEPDLVPDNNFKPFSIELVDRPLRVLFVEGYPRWEYRYLKNLLVREASIESSVMLISADRDFAQEGNQPITRLPRSPEEFAEFDVIVLGDVPATFFSPDQFEMIRDQVGRRGAGLLWIGGERSTPRTFAGTVLTDVLPMRGSLDLSPIGEAVNMRPTVLAQRLGVLRLATGAGVGWPRELSDASYGWSQFSFAQRIEPGRLKPTAEVLAETVTEVGADHLPLVIHMRYGAGQSIYVATDEVWRWRYGRGELLPEQFWVQLIRMLGRESLSQSGAPAELDVTPRRAQTNRPVRMLLRILDAQLAQAPRASVNAVIEDASGNEVTEIELRPEPGAEAEFVASYVPDAPGALRVRIADPALPDLALQATVEIFSPEDELRHPETDHQVLRGLAAATGGAVLDTGSLSDLSQLLPNRSVRTLNPLTERIWDTPLIFALVLLTLAGEWIGRKALRLA
jgi:hypothetical protein